MTFQVLRHERHVSMPWANGGGTTREVVRRDSEGTAFDWRLSFADVVQSGPFSALPGCDRVITLVEGDELELKVDGRTHVLRPAEPYAFRGEDEVWCTTRRPTVDFNVMTRRGAWTAEVACRSLTGRAEVLGGPTPGGERLVAVLAGFPAVLGPRGALVSLRAYDVVRAGVDPLVFTGDARLAVVDLRPA